MILNPASQWADHRKRLFARIPNYQPPAKLLQELGEDDGRSQDARNQQRVVQAFKVLRDKLHQWAPGTPLTVPRPFPGTCWPA